MNDGNVIDFKTQRREVPGERTVNPEAVKLLEGFLEKAKRGEIRGLAFSIAYDDAQTVATGWTTGNLYHQLHSGVATLLTRMGRADD